jgi:prepilin-type processing-associated H-X9-DG protein
MTVCEKAPQLPNGYVYNSSIAGKQLGDPTVLPHGEKDAINVFVTADGQHTAADGRSPNVAYTITDLDTSRHATVQGTYHSPARFIAAFLDGHAEALTPEQAKGWLP